MGLLLLKSMNLSVISGYITSCEPQMRHRCAIIQQRSADAPSTKKPEGNSEGNPKGPRQRSSSSISQSECEGLGRDPAPDTDRTLHMLRSNLRSNGIYNIGGSGNQLGFPLPSSPPDGADIVHTARQSIGLAINDAEYPEIGEEEMGKFRFGVLPIQASPNGPIYHISFKPKGTTSLNNSLCSLLRLITQLQGKLLTKNFDGPTLGSRVSGIEKLKYKRKVSDILFDQFMSAAESHWDYLFTWI